jgi:hypothetical protein
MVAVDAVDRCVRIKSTACSRSSARDSSRRDESFRLRGLVRRRIIGDLFIEVLDDPHRLRDESIGFRFVILLCHPKPMHTNHIGQPPRFIQNLIELIGRLIDVGPQSVALHFDVQMDTAFEDRHARHAATSTVPRLFE